MTRVGDRVSLISCSDEHTRLRPGEMGTVRYIDPTGTVHVSWDSGPSLGLIPEAGDSWAVVQPTADEIVAAGPHVGETWLDENRRPFVVVGADETVVLVKGADSPKRSLAHARGAHMVGRNEFAAEWTRQP